MTAEEARELTKFGIWGCIETNIKDTIVDACNEGYYETTVDKMRLNDADKVRLEQLGYTVTLDNTDRFCPVYYINWKH